MMVVGQDDGTDVEQQKSEVEEQEGSIVLGGVMFVYCLTRYIKGLFLGRAVWLYLSF